MACGCRGTGNSAQIDQGRAAAAASSSEAATARESRATDLTAAQGDGVGGGVVHDSVGMSQARVHTEDTSVTLGPRADDAGSASTSTALTVGGGDHTVALPEGVYDVNGQQLDTRRENSWLLKLGEVQTVVRQPSINL